MSCDHTLRSLPGVALRASTLNLTLVALNSFTTCTTHEYKFPIIIIGLVSYNIGLVSYNIGLVSYNTGLVSYNKYRLSFV